MNIMVFDVPASSGGALSILKDFYDEVKTESNKSIKWFFVLSMPELEDTENIRIFRFPWIKKSWVHRLYFDYFVAPKLIKKYNIDTVLSFQNIIVPHIKVPQIVYVHQSLPFVDYRFSFKENKLFWMYQNIIGKLIKISIKKAKKVIVQTDWMKKACIEQVGIDTGKINVISPKINLNINSYFKPSETNIKRFFFPAGAQSYKNHRIIVESCKRLKKQGINDYNVIFTLKGNENNSIATLYEEVKELDLPIEFVGGLSREGVFELYTKSILIFPSYIETFGLPMLEARLHKTIILASNCPFSNEILKEYENAYFFNPFNSSELKNLMEKAIMNEIEYKECDEDIGNMSGNGWKDLLNELY